MLARPADEAPAAATGQERCQRVRGGRQRRQNRTRRVSPSVCPGQRNTVEPIAAHASEKLGLREARTACAYTGRLPACLTSLPAPRRLRHRCKSVQTSQKLSILSIVALVGIALTPAAARAQLRQIAFVPGDGNNTVSRVTLPDMNQTASIAVGTTRGRWPSRRTASGSTSRTTAAPLPTSGSTTRLTGTGITTLSTFGSPHGLAITPDGSKLYVALQSHDDVEVWDLATHTRITTRDGRRSGPRRSPSTRRAPARSRASSGRRR